MAEISFRTLTGKDLRAARAAGFDQVVYCAVIRPNDHPRRPAACVSHDGFGRIRGYERMDGVVCQFRWCDIGDSTETRKPMQFWMRRLPVA